MNKTYRIYCSSVGRIIYDVEAENEEQAMEKVLARWWHDNKYNIIKGIPEEIE